MNLTKHTTKNNIKSMESGGSSILSMSGSLDLDSYEIEDELGNS
jgi:hypothetical protein